MGVGPEPVLGTTGVGGAVVGAGQTFGQVVAVSVGGVAKFIWPPNMFGFIVDALSGAPDESATDTPTEASQTPSTVSETRPISIVGVAMLGSDLTSQDMSSLVLFLAQLNIFIGAFNLFPVYPFGGDVTIDAAARPGAHVVAPTQRYLARHSPNCRVRCPGWSACCWSWVCWRSSWT